MNKTKIIFASLLAMAALTLAGCGQKDVSFDTLETARSQAKSNAEYNAQGFRAGNASFGGFAIEMQGDSTQLPNCPQGDGWASGRLVNRDNPAQKVAIKCSTVSGAVGCMTQDDFQKKPYAGDDGKCQDTTKVPFPLPKVAK